MGAPTPELFADGTCGRRLPAGELLQEFRFGQFSPLRQIVGTSEAGVIVGRRRPHEPATRTQSLVASAVVGGRAPHEKRVVAFAELLAGDADSQAAPVESTTVTVPPEQLATAIATGRLSDRYTAWDVELSAATVERLIDGQTAELPATRNGVEATLRVTPLMPIRDPSEGGGGGGGYGGGQGDTGSGGGDLGGGGPGPTVEIQLTHQIPEAELGAWLADPWTEDVDGTRLSLTLSPSNVTDLTGKGQTTVHVRGYKVKVSVKKAPKIDPPPSGGDPPTGGTGTGTPTTTTTTTTTTTPTPDADYDPECEIDPAGDDDVVLAVYFEWVQSWTLTGFSRGRMLQSLALAPQEETTVELFTWDRRTTVFERITETDGETTTENEQKTQDADECMREITRKTEFELSAGGSVDAHYNGGTVQVGVLVNGKIESGTNVDDVVKNTHKTLTEGLHRSVTRIRTRRSSKVTETTESGSEERITRRVRNPNLCHTLNLDYFEVLTHYEVLTRFNEDGMRFCAMIRNPVAERRFAPAFIRRHEGPLRDALLDRALAPGFDALRFLRAREVAVDELGKRRANRPPALTSSPAPTPTPTGGTTEEESAANNYLAALQRAAQMVMDASRRQGLKGALDALDQHLTPSGASLDAGKRWLAQQLFLRSFSQLSMELRELAKETQTLSIREWGPRLEALVPGPMAMPKPSQLNLESQETKQGLLIPVLDKWVKLPADWGWWWGEIKRVGLLEVEDAGLGALVEQFPKVYRDFLEAQKRKADGAAGTQAVDKALQSQDALTEEDRLDNDFPLQDFAVAQERAEVLERHLREHAAHYSFALFQALPPQEQLNHIEQAMAGIEVPFAPGYFQPRAVAQIGPRLLIPLNHQMIPWSITLLSDLRDQIEVPDLTDTVMLPSPGMTIESRLGTCSACEDFIERSREIELRRLGAMAQQAELEAARMQARLKAQQLGDPKPVPAPLVQIEESNGAVPTA
jgi:hypothetical protein